MCSTILRRCRHIATARLLVSTAVALCTLHTLRPPAYAAYVVGSWDLSRGGFDSIADAPEQAAQRSLIQSYRSDVVFTSTSVLTSSYLSSVKTFVLGGQRSSSASVSPLSSAEQSALFNFVSAGGTLVVATYNGSFDGAAGDASRASIYAPFGMETDGSSTGPAVATDLTHPIVQGPYGTLTSFPHNGASGWYTQLGPYAHTVFIEAQFSNPVLVTIEAGVISPTSGRVVLTGAANAFASQTLSGNVAAYVIPVPEPGTAFQAGTLLVVAVWGIRRDRSRRRSRLGERDLHSRSRA